MHLRIVAQEVVQQVQRASITIKQDDDAEDFPELFPELSIKQEAPSIKSAAENLRDIKECENSISRLESLQQVEANKIIRKKSKGHEVDSEDEKDYDEIKAEIKTKKKRLEELKKT